MKKLLLVPLFGLFTVLAFAQCPPTSALSTPYVESFNGVSTGNQLTFSNCWTQTGISTPSWRAHTGGTSSSNTGPLGGHNACGSPSGNYMYLETSGGTTGSMMEMETPDINLTGLTSPELTFYYHMYGASMGTMKVEIYNSTTTSWDSVWSKVGQQHTTATAAWSLASISLSSYANKTIQVRFTGIRGTSFTGDMSFDDFRIDNAANPNCAAPTCISFSNVTATSAYAHWVSTGTAYSVEYGVSGFTWGTGTTVTTTADSVLMTGLTANTQYDVIVRNNCGGTNGNSLWSSPGTLTTSCAAMQTPVVEGFEGVSPGNTVNPSLPNCWDYVETPAALGYGYTYNYALYAHTGVQSFRMYNSNNALAPLDTMFVVTPEIMGLDSGTKQITFWARPGNTSSSHKVKVGTVNNAGDISSFNLITTVSIPQVLQHEEFIILLDSASGNNLGHSRIALMHGNDVNYQSIYLDDISIEDIPPCPKPVGFVLDFVTSSTAGISWSGNGVAYNGEVGPTGFTQGTGSFFYPTQNSDTLTNLASNTWYDVYVQNNCQASGNGTSVWNGPFTFQTLCNALATPFTEDFESATPGASNNPTVPDCWKYTMTTNGGFGYGYTRNYSAFAHGGNQLFYMYHSNTTDTMALVSPEVDSMDLKDKHIQFWARGAYASATYDESIIIGTVSTPGDLSTFSPVDTVSIKGTTYQFFDVYLDAANGYNGTDTYIAMVANTGAITYGYFCIDDITIADVPSCTPSTNLALSNVTNNSAVATWTAGAGLSQQLEYGPTGFTQGTGAIQRGLTTGSYSITGLTGNSCYDVYVRDTCANVLSPWFGPITFCTSCDPQATPLLEDFETTAAGNTSSPNPPNCWSYWKNPASSYYAYTYAFATPNGTRHWRSYMFNTNDTIALISPPVGGITTTAKQVRFKAKSGTTFSETDVIVGTSPSAGDLRGATIIDTIRAAYNYGVHDYVVRFDTASGYNGTDQYIFFMQGSFYTQMYLDDINIEDIPLCGAPWNVGSSSITSSSADISWATVYGTSFQIEYGPQGFVQGTGNGTYVNNVTSGATISGLSPNTYYDVYVADNCDTLDQAGPYTFKTNCVGQLSGNYTIGGTGANFATLDSAISLLAGCGVSGPTTLTLQNNDTASIGLDVIAGGSSTNSVVLQGSSSAASDTIFIPNGIYDGIELNGTSHITFKDLTIVGNTVTRLVWLHNNAHHITFDNCNLIMPASTSGLYAVVAGTSMPTSISGGGDNANDITIKNCDVTGAYYGISFYGTNTSNRSMNMTVENCVMRDQGYYGIRAYYMDGVNIKDNDIDVNGGSNGIAMYMYYDWNLNIVGNSAYSPTYAMYMYRPNYLNTTSSTRSTITNNFLGGANSYGIYGGYWEDLDIVHNSIRGGGVYGLYVYGLTDSMDIRNNIIVGGSNYAIYNSATATNITNVTVDHNVYHTETGSNIAYWGGSIYAALTNWQAADITMNVNSLQGSPGFISNKDFHIVGTLPNDVGDNGAGILEDIDGDTRPATGSTIVDIGADEFTPLNWDASLEGLIVKLAGCGDSVTTVEAIVKNYGQNTITSLPITVNVTGGMAQVMNVNYTTSILSGMSDTVMMGSINTYAGAAGVMFSGYTALTGDQKNTNDTISNVGPGNYTPVEPQHYPEDTVCANADSAYFAAVAVPGVQYGWYANATDTVPSAVGDTLDFAVSGGQPTWYLAYLESADSLTTTMAGGNGQAGNAFDVLPTATISITGVDMHISNTGANTVNIYYRSGTYTGFTGSTAGWTLHESVAVTGAGTNAKTPTPFSSPMVLPGGSVSGLMFVISAGGSVAYTNGTTTGALLTSNSDIIVYQGSGVSWPLGSNFNPRNWNGTLHYGSAGCSGIKKALTIGMNTDTAVSAFTHVVDPNGADVDFDASASIGHTWTWDFGDGGVGTGQMTTHTYANGTYTACLVVTDTICGSSDSICTTVNASVGIDEGLIGETLTVYPNPNDGIFRVDFEIEGLKDIEIRITDVTGKLVYSKEVGKASGAYRENIDISNYAKGMYLLQIKTDDVVVSRRVTIQ